MKPRPTQCRFFYITGSDGTGKSTHSRLLRQHLAARGMRCRRLWARFPFFFSMPLLAFARWRGYSWHIVNGRVDHGYWDFRNSPLMRAVFPWVLLVDAALAAFFRVRIPLLLGGTIVCERFALDTLADLSVALHDTSFCRRLPGRLFPALVPNGARIVVLDLDEATIRSRRPDLQSDDVLSWRLLTFRRLAEYLALPLVENYAPVNQVHRRILAEMDLL